MKKATFLILFLATLFLGAMESPNFHHIIVPGQNNMGGENYKELLFKHDTNFSRYIAPGNETSLFSGRYNTPAWQVDLGQGNCVRDFEKQLNNDTKAKDKSLMLHGVSQGTATLINWLAEQPNETQGRVKCLTLEAVLGSGNSAIDHTVEKLGPGKAVTYLPFARMWLPVGAKIAAFPTYNPVGKQALSSAKNLPKDLPIIIMHSTNDPQLSINDARKLYITLKKNGNNNAYLIEVPTESRSHFQIINDLNVNDKKKYYKAIQEIYKKHNLPHDQSTLDQLKETPVDLKEFQPEEQEINQRIKQTQGSSRLIRNGIDFTMASIIGAYLIQLFFG